MNIEFVPCVRCFLQGAVEATHDPDCFCVVLCPFKVFIKKIVTLDAVMIFVFLQDAVSVTYFE